MQSVQFDAEVQAERAQSQARLAYQGVLPQAKRIIEKALRIGRGAFAFCINKNLGQRVNAGSLSQVK